MADPSNAIEFLEQARVGLTRFAIAAEIMAEAKRGSDLHDNSHLIDGTGRGQGRDVVRQLTGWQDRLGTSMADAARRRCQSGSGTVADSWELVLTEKIFEAFEEDPGSPALRGELIQCGAVIVNWILSLDDRPVADIDTDEEE